MNWFFEKILIGLSVLFGGTRHIKPTLRLITPDSPPEPVLVPYWNNRSMTSSSCHSFAPQGPCIYEPGKHDVQDQSMIDLLVPPWYFNGYQEEALKTANCPVIGHPFVYPLLGLVGEVGEVYEKLIHRMSSGTMNGIWRYPEREDILKELGDCLWYVAVMADRLGLKLSDLASSGTLSMTSFANASVRNDSIHLASSYNIMLKLQDLSISQGQLSERVKKVFRDGEGDFDGPRRADIIGSLAMVLWNLARLSRALRFDFSLVAYANIEKLRSRRERNVISGEGDNR